MSKDKKEDGRSFSWKWDSLRGKPSHVDREDLWEDEAIEKAGFKPTPFLCWEDPEWEETGTYVAAYVNHDSGEYMIHVETADHLAACLFCKDVWQLRDALRYLEPLMSKKSIIKDMQKLLFAIDMYVEDGLLRRERPPSIEGMGPGDKKIRMGRKFLSDIYRLLLGELGAGR